MPQNGSCKQCEEHDANPAIDNGERIPNRLILGFDGTGNSFQGSESDTNIVKLMDMFDRSAPRQMHYYQPGIGTYSTTGGVNQGIFGRMSRSVSQSVDAALATSFDAHVIAGYRFLMRYYGKGDRIYIFGFSRGAFTGRFLARMIYAVGLLSMGNEEMVPFAYKVYQDYEMNLPSPEKAEAYTNTFRSAFCRHDRDIGIKVHFLGLFDTVNSVGTFDIGLTGDMKAPDVIGTAEHVRHAVAIDERRVKFKAALLAQDERSNKSSPEDSKEVWFPGNHGDIGGGWPAEVEVPMKKLGIWERIKRAWVGAKDTSDPHVDKTDDPFQLSDIPLKWMIDEMDAIETAYKTDGVKWNHNKHSFLERIGRKRHQLEAISGRMHDTMSFGGGSSFWKAIMWKLMECLPIIRRWEFQYSDNKWHLQRFPLNMGGTRDIPPGAVFHHSVIERVSQYRGSYHPRNDIGRSSDNREFRLKSVDPESKPGEVGDGVPYFKEVEDSDRKRVDGEVEEHDRCYHLMFKTKDGRGRKVEECWGLRKRDLES